MDEEYLIQAAKKGDLDAFNRLVLAYQDMVYNQALRMLNDEASAADAAQDAFVSAFRHLRGFRGGVFKAWLMRIVTNACYDDLRRQKRRPSIPLEPLDDSGDEIDSPKWLTDPGDTPEESMQRDELEQVIVRCLNNLPEDFRSVVLLVDVQGFNYLEASQSIGKPVGTIKSRLARARLRLRDCLQSFGELLPMEFRLKDEN